MSLRHTTGRVVGGTVAVALLGLAVPGQSSASAPDEDRGASISEVAPAADDQAVAARRTTRDITIDGAEPRPSQFFISGKIRPEYDRKQVIVERKVGKGKYKTYKRIQTNGKSRYRTGVAELRNRGKVFYRTKTAATKNFKVSYSDGAIVIETF